MNKLKIIHILCIQLPHLPPSQQNSTSGWSRYFPTLRLWQRGGEHESSMQDQHDQFCVSSVNPEHEPTILRNVSSTSLKVDLKSRLGRGAFAKVYVGRLIDSGEECAVKVFNNNVPAEDVGKEFQRMDDLKHPNIVHVFGMIPAYKVQGRNALVIVMELCDMSLDQYIKKHSRKGISKKVDLLQILHDMASAMVHLHSQDMVHGDLKSPNVLVTDSGDNISAKITDFGYTRCLNEAGELMTTMFADAKYLPPEVFVSSSKPGSRNKWAKLSRKVDVFSYGLIAIELGCGEFPEPTAKTNTKKGVLVKSFTEIQRREKHIKKVNKAHGECIELIVQQCMQDRPEERASFSEVLLTVKGFQKWCRRQPDGEWIEEKQVCLCEVFCECCDEIEQAYMSSLVNQTPTRPLFHECWQEGVWFTRLLHWVLLFLLL